MSVAEQWLNSIDAFVYWYPVGMEADELGGGNIIPVGNPSVRYVHNVKIYVATGQHYKIYIKNPRY